MTSSQLILVAVTSALISVFTMLFVATLRRARTRDDKKPEPATRRAPEQVLIDEEAPATSASAAPAKPASKTSVAGTAAKKASAKKTAAKKASAKKTTTKKTTSKKAPARKAPATRKKR